MGGTVRAAGSRGGVVARAFACALVVTAICGRAKANGKFPEAGQLAVAPDDPAHLALRTTFGLLDSRDGGQSWHLVCEAAMGYQDYEPAFGLASESTFLLGLQEGVTRSSDGCVWGPAAGALADQFVVDLSVSRLDPSLAVAITFDAAQTQTMLWRSEDGGASWVAHGSALPVGFIGYTLDLAPASPSTIYVSGLTGDPPAGVMARSVDDGMTWEMLAIPTSNVNDAPFIGGLDPLDDATVYVRLAGQTGRLLGTFDAGATWTELFVGRGFMRGFAVAPDGSQILLGGEGDGTWRADVPPKAEAANADAWQLEPVSDFVPFCLSWLGNGDVLACGHVFYNDGAAVSRSSDAGATFERLLCFNEIDVALSCRGGGDLTATCADELASIKNAIPSGSCGAPDPTTTSSGTGGFGGSAAAGGGAGSGGGRSASNGSDGCSCVTAGRRPGGRGIAVTLAIIAVLVGRRASGRRGGSFCPSP